MQTNMYTLPEWNFVGGETQRRSFTLMKQNGSIYDLPSSTASLSIVDFVNPGMDPIVTKQVPVEDNKDGKFCEVIFGLSPADTVDLSGKYIYQVTIKDASGNTSIPRRGYMHIIENIDKAFAV